MEAGIVARIRVLYWKEIPVQVQVETGGDRVSQMLDHRFQEAVDAVAMFEGSMGSDAYLEGWEWMDHGRAPGNPRQLAQDLAGRFNRGLPEDLAARICRLHRAGQRDERPGALERWISDGPFADSSGRISS